MVDVVPFGREEPEDLRQKDPFCVLDPRLVSLAEGQGRARLTFLFKKQLDSFPCLGFCYLLCDRIRDAPVEEVRRYIEVLPAMDEITDSIFNRPVQNGDIFQFEFRFKRDPFTIGFKVQLMSDGYETGWSQWSVSQVPPDIRLAIMALKNEFCVMDFHTFTDYSLFGPSKLFDMSLECCICYHKHVPISAFLCGHTTCIDCRGKISCDGREECHICSKKIEDQVEIRLWDSGCPIDRCGEGDSSFILRPCGCTFFHKDKPDFLAQQPCPFKGCGQLVERVMQVFLGGNH